MHRCLAGGQPAPPILREGTNMTDTKFDIPFKNPNIPGCADR